MSDAGDGAVTVRLTAPADFDGIIDLTREVYPGALPWHLEQLASHLATFPEGQFVAVDKGGRVIGMAASLIVLWDDYDVSSSWRDFTAGGTFANHDPVNGRTLYGAEVMVRPSAQGVGVGTKLYAVRQELAERLGLLRIRAGARLRGYHEVASIMTAREYVDLVVRGVRWDPTLSFQLRRGFTVLDVIGGYLRNDAESLGYAAIIEWINPRAAAPTPR